ncbi:DUF2169 domain-containing protein [Pseudomonas sp. DSP3-2-2]|uniref:DUF2169 domain-containing protein n=1 Tax=unclassified Pseudomonas TaxID=196821 RepID=UPI003CE9BA2D
MRLNDEHVSSLSVARYRDAHGPCIVVTVGVLYGADHVIVPAAETQAWLAERFDKQPFDRGMKKSRGTFAVQGNAYALNPAQQQGMAVRAQISTLEKVLHIHPPRQWHKGMLGWNPQVCGVLSVLPLELGLAYGGEGSPDNPQGIGYAINTDRAQGLALPQIESSVTPLRAPGEQVPVASFGPLLPQSTERQNFLGTCDNAWLKRRAPFAPLDTDLRWFDEVAQDQCRVGFWSGSEAWAVAGMHPEKAEVAGYLPGFRLRLFVARQALDSVSSAGHNPFIDESSLDLDTVWLFPDAERVLLLYRAQVAVLDIDGDDLVGVAAVCERAGEAVQSKAHWDAELWSQPGAEAAAAEEEPIPQHDDAAALAPDMQAALAFFMADPAAFFAQIDAEHASLSAELDTLVVDAGATMSPAELGNLQTDLAALVEPMKKALDADYASLAAERGELAFLESPASAAPVDGPAVLSQIETSTARLQEALEQELQELTQKLEALPPEIVEQAKAQMGEDLSPRSPLFNEPLSPAHAAAIQADIEAINALIPEQIARLEEEAAELGKKLAGFDPAIFESLPPAPQPDWTRELLQAAHDEQRGLDDERLVNLNLDGIDLRSGVFKNCSFETCSFKGALLSAANLSGTRFIGCDLSSANIEQTMLAGTFFERCDLQQIKARQANFDNAWIADTDFSAADLNSSECFQGYFDACRFLGAQLVAAKWTGVRWQHCDLSGSALSTSQLRDIELHACQLDNVDFRGADLHSADWSDSQGHGVDLSNARLQQWRLDLTCRLPGVRLDGADMTGASLQQAQLQSASLRGACLKGALVSHCDLSDSDGYHLNASGADFTASDLSRAKWIGANLFEARLRKVRLDAANLSGSNLHGVNSEGVKGVSVQTQGALMTRCRLVEDLEHA